jgi:hypothetical protein
MELLAGEKLGEVEPHPAPSPAVGLIPGVLG